jgi:hypothetical protein
MVENFLELLKGLYKDFREAGGHGSGVAGGSSTGITPEHRSCSI